MYRSTVINSDDNNKFVRVRKPPGGETSDIFNIGTSKTIWNQDGEKHDLGKTFLGEKIKACNLDGYRRNSPKVSELDKENVVEIANSDDFLAIRKLGDGDLEYKPDKTLDEDVLKMSLEEEEGEDGKSQNFVCRNPITGEMSKVEVGRPKLKDSSNKMGQNTVDMGLSRPSIRIHQPPGGVSSNIFNV